MGEPACEGLITKVLKLAYRALNLVLLVRVHRRHACPALPTRRERAPRHLQAIGAVTVKRACGLDPAGCFGLSQSPRCERQSPGTATAGKRVGSPRIAAHWASSSIR
jgi:hypothetical protein